MITELIKQFISNAEGTAATVEKIRATADSLNTALLSVSGNETLLFAETEYLNTDLFSRFKLNENVITQPTNEQLLKIKTGITDAFCGIASTGSVCVAINNNLSAPISMLTRKHVVVLDGKVIVEKPRDIFSESFYNGKALPESFSIITGPSATADMGPLVRGVHGPGKLHIIILE